MRYKLLLSNKAKRSLLQEDVFIVANVHLTTSIHMDWFKRIYEYGLQISKTLICTEGWTKLVMNVLILT
ncbi:unnamed protein product [Caretta caretta]